MKSRVMRVGLALAGVYFIWGSTYLANRVALQSFPPVLMSALRFFIAGGAFFLLLRARGVPPPSPREWGGAAIVGALLPAAGSGGAAFAQQWIASGLAAVAMATIPLWASLFAGLSGRWPTRLEWGALVFGFIGVGLLHLEGDLRTSPIGAGVLLLAAVSWGFGSIWSQRLLLPSGSMGTAAQLLIAGMLLLVISMAFGERIERRLAGASVLALAYLVVFGSLVGYGAYMYLLRNVRPTLATSYAYVNPVVAIALGIAVAGERISGIGWVAMLVILASVAVLTLEQRPGARESPAHALPPRTQI